MQLVCVCLENTAQILVFYSLGLNTSYTSGINLDRVCYMGKESTTGQSGHYHFKMNYSEVFYSSEFK